MVRSCHMEVMHLCVASLRAYDDVFDLARAYLFNLEFLQAPRIRLAVKACFWALGQPSSHFPRSLAVIPHSRPFGANSGFPVLLFTYPVQSLQIPESNRVSGDYHAELSVYNFSCLSLSVHASVVSRHSLTREVHGTGLLACQMGDFRVRPRVTDLLHPPVRGDGEDP